MRADFSILSEKEILHADLFDVNETELVIKGKKHTYRNVHIHSAVFILPITDKKELYIIKQYRHLLKKILNRNSCWLYKSR